MTSKKFRAVILPCTLFFLFTAFSGSVFAHGTDYRIINGADTVTVECVFTDGEPMQYAEVVLYSPENTTMEYQNGRTDKQGIFAFYPQSSGIWRMEVSDGMGHAIQAEIDVIPQNDTDAGGYKTIAEQQHGNESSGLFKAVLGISLIINIFWGISLGKRKRREADAMPPES